MINNKVKMALIRKNISQLKAAKDLALDVSRFRRNIGSFECNNEITEKIARYLNMKPTDVNSLYPNTNGRHKKAVQDVV